MTQGGREGHNEASPNLDYSTRGLLVTTGQLIYSREQGERSQVKSWGEGVYTEYRILSIYGGGEDGKQGNQMIARQSNCENNTTKWGRSN